MFQGLDDRAIDDRFRQINAQRVFDEIEHWLTATYVTTHVDVRLEVRNDSVVSLVRLKADSFEEKPKALHETRLHIGTCIFEATD